MLSPDYLKALGKVVEEKYAELEDEIISDIARRIVSTNFQITQSAVWQAEKLQQVGMLRKDIIKRVAKATKQDEKFVEELFMEGGLETLEYDDEVYKNAGLNPLPLKQSPGMLNVITASAKKCNGTLKNLTKTTASTACSAYRIACDSAYMKVVSGTFDYNSAIKTAVRQVSVQGAKVVYPSGATAQLDVAVRRAVLTGVNQTCGEIQKMRFEEMGGNLVETSAHMGARPDHAEWQGQVFWWKEKVEGYENFEDITGYGTGDGLMGWNCRHGFFPYFEGSKRAYTDEELKELKEHKVTYNGKEYTDNEASQIQRKYERSIRSTKRELAGYQAADLTDEYTKAAVKLKKQNTQLTDFLRQTGRAEERARVQVQGFGRSEAQKAVWQVKKNTLTNANGDSILKVNKTKIREAPNSITQRENPKGGIERNYYGSDGRQTKQISNNHHNHKAVMGYGKNGEHAHDYIYDENGHLIDRPHRKLTDEERKENVDIL